jgi:hypothetical protein
MLRLLGLPPLEKSGHAWTETAATPGTDTVLTHQMTTSEDCPIVSLRSDLVSLYPRFSCRPALLGWLWLFPAQNWLPPRPCPRNFALTRFRALSSVLTLVAIAYFIKGQNSIKFLNQLQEPCPWMPMSLRWSRNGVLTLALPEISCSQLLCRCWSGTTNARHCTSTGIITYGSIEWGSGKMGPVSLIKWTARVGKHHVDDKGLFWVNSTRRHILIQ